RRRCTPEDSGHGMSVAVSALYAKHLPSPFVPRSRMGTCNACARSARARCLGYKRFRGRELIGGKTAGRVRIGSGAARHPVGGMPTRWDQLGLVIPSLLMRASSVVRLRPRILPALWSPLMRQPTLSRTDTMCAFATVAFGTFLFVLIRLGLLASVV